MSWRRNPVNLKELPGSKWTAAVHRRGAKLFTVLDRVRDAEGAETEMVEIEAILTDRAPKLHRRELANREVWPIGRCRSGWGEERVEPDFR
jgi:hypothetical protein